jgi:AcrR family transcriptional regulator/DNA-binding HxlR family transcriptional regulator
MGRALMSAELEGEPRMPVGGAHGGGVYVSGLVRGRLLSAVFSLVGEWGYEGVSTRSVAERAGASTSTFYQCFSDREDCFLAAFSHAVDELERELRAGWESELGWTARVRAGLTALLLTLDREPAVGRLVFVEALAAGPRVLARRARVLEQLAVVIDQGRVNAKAPARLPGLVAEGVLGATFGVIHARVLEVRSEPLVGLLGQLMATIVLPYRGSAAAARELERPAPRLPARPRDGDRLSRLPMASASPVDGGSASPVDFRLTARAQSALVAVASRPGLNSREVSELVGLADQGQVSRMMKRLAGQGLVENTQAHTKRQARAWRLTADGETVIDVHKGGRASIKAQRRSGKGGGRVANSPSGRPGKTRIAAAGTDLAGGRLRMTVLTRQVLAAVSELSRWGSNPSNRKIATAVGVKDEGQISKHLARLQHHGLLENTGGATAGAPNAWQLTRHGEEVQTTSRNAAQ